MQYFMISHHFNKTSLTDFGLIFSDGKFVCSDGCEWIPRGLYDFGWGPENGYCRFPQPDFSVLITLVSQNLLTDDVYGAASVLMDDYPKELLDFLESLMKNNCAKATKKHLCSLFKLNRPLNLTYKPDMSLEEIKKEHLRWQNVTDFFCGNLQ